jgi:hypothetical protein
VYFQFGEDTLKWGCNPLGSSTFILNQGPFYGIESSIAYELRNPEMEKIMVLLYHHFWA